MTVDAAVVDRIERERRFHDDRFAEDGEETRDRFYDFVDGARQALARATETFGPGDRVLELGAGDSQTGWDLATRGVEVVSIDISPVAVERAREEARAGGLTTIEFAEMNAEALEFGDASFDGVVGSGILHHLDLEAALSEIRRVLRPDGRAVFYEPLGHNPVINAYRARTPGMRTEDEHPLVASDFTRARDHFGVVRATMHHCLVIGCALLPRSLSRVLRPALDLVDRTVLRLPGLRWMAWITVVELRDPH